MGWTDERNTNRSTAKRWQAEHGDGRRWISPDAARALGVRMVAVVGSRRILTEMDMHSVIQALFTAADMVADLERKHDRYRAILAQMYRTNRKRNEPGDPGYPTATQERYQKMHRRAQRAESRAARQEVQLARAYRMLIDWRRNHEKPDLYDPIDPCRVGAWLAHVGSDYRVRTRGAQGATINGPLFPQGVFAPKPLPLDTVPADLSPTRCQAGSWGAP